MPVALAAARAFSEIWRAKGWVASTRMSTPFGFEVAGEALRAAEAADAGGRRLRGGGAGAAGEGEGDPVALGEAGGERAGLRRAAEDEDVAHAGI